MATIYKLVSDDTNSLEQQPMQSLMTPAVSAETDDEIIERMRRRFDVLDNMTHAVKQGHVRSMIVSGPPGVGKSFGVERVLSIFDTQAALSGMDPEEEEQLKPYEIVRGTMSALHLYLKLYTFKERKNVIAFDDCDSVLLDDESLSMLKAALDSTGKRYISWHKQSKVLEEYGIPNTFEFQGGAIFITNLKFANIRSAKLRDHLAALQSRSHFVDLTINTDREKMLRIKQIVLDGMLHKYFLGPEVEAQILNFVQVNQAKMRDLSLRSVIKIAELVKSFPGTWQDMAEVTLLM